MIPHLNVGPWVWIAKDTNAMDRETMPPKMMKRTIYINCCSISTNLFNGFTVEDTKHVSQAFGTPPSFLFLVYIVWLSYLND